MSPSEEQLKAAIKGGEAVVWDDDGPSPVPPKRVYNHYVACEGVCKLMHGSGPLIKSVKHPRAPGRGYRSNGQRAAKLKAPVGVLSLSHYPSLKAAELLAKEQAMASVKVIEVAA